MLETKVMVAPNSPKARAKASTAPTTIPGAAIGNVTGSNSVNVFLGLGLPWVIAVAIKGGNYEVPKGDLVFSILLFSCCAITLFVILMLRRWLCGGELGGARFSKTLSAVVCFSLWIIYVLGSIAKTKKWLD